MNKKIILALSICALPLSMAFAGENTDLEQENKGHIENSPNINSKIVEEYQTNGHEISTELLNGNEEKLPPSNMQIPDSLKNGTIGEQQELKQIETIDAVK